MKKSKKKIVTAHSSEYGKIVNETKSYYTNWLCASGISEEVFLTLVDREDFSLNFSSDATSAMITLFIPAGEIAMPLVWQKENGISFKSYKTDASLLLMMVSSKCSNKESQDKIKDFVRDNLHVK